MPTIAEVRSQYPQYSDMSDVELAGALHDKFYSDMPADQFAEKIGLKPDKYQQAALDERDALKPNDAGYTRRLIHGYTLGADSTIAAGVFAPVEAIKRGVGLGEGYNYAKAREDLIMDQARKNTGALGAGVEMLGGGVAGGALAPYGATRFLSATAPSLLGRTAAFGADSAALGGIAGFNEGNSLDERLGNAGRDALVGGLLGSALPVAGTIIKGVASPFIANLMAQINPRGFAERQIARGVTESGRSTAEIANDVAQAAREGQGAYTLADAMGNPGQRLLSTVTRAPGEGRTMAVQALDARQGDQGRRLATALRDGFDAPHTAEQARADMIESANFEAGHNYAPVKRETMPIDVSVPVSIANRAISPAADNIARAQGAIPTDLAARTGIETSEAALRDPIGAALKEARSYLAAPTLTLSNVNQAFRAKTNIDMMISKATTDGKGALVEELVPIKNALDDALANTSSNYAAARDAYRLAQARIKALDLGKLLGSRPGRPEDAIRQFSDLPDRAAQTAFRRGYVDPFIRDAQNAAGLGTNKARTLTSPAVQEEFSAFVAPGRGDKLTRQIAREQTMFETRNAAMGGSKTADNLNDHAAMSVDPHLVGQIVTGNWSGAARSVISAGSNAITGNTPAVRAAVADILLQRGANVTPAALDRMVGETIRKIQTVQRLAMNGGRVAAGAAAQAPEATKKKSKATRIFIGN